MDKLQDKVKLPKEIGEYIEDLLIGATKEEFLAGVLGNANALKYVAIRNYFKEDFDSLLQSLVNGYEVEQTPEDKVREFFDKMQEIRNLDQVNAVLTVLRILNINIKGVNAE